MGQKVRAALGDQFKAYTFSSYPTDNFGLATAYDPARGGDMSDENFLCATWSCLRQQPPKGPRKKLEVNGFAEVGGNGALITLTEKEQSEFGGSVVVPEIYKVLKVSADARTTKGIQTQLRLGRAYPRKLIRSKMTAVIRDLLPTI
jgi:hypothetical protein